MMTSVDDQVKAYIKKIMSQLSKWMQKSKISKLVVVITSKETGEHVERWQFDVSSLFSSATVNFKRIGELSGEEDGTANRTKVNIFNQDPKKKSSQTAGDKENSDPQTSLTAEKSETDIQQEIQSLFRQITASVTFLPMLDGNCTFNVLVYADADSEVPLEWGDSDAKEVKNAEKVMLRSFSTNSHKIDTVVSYRYVLNPTIRSQRLLTLDTD